MEPVPLSIILAAICVVTVGFTVWSRRLAPGHDRRAFAVMLGAGELVAGSILLLSGDVGNVQQAVGAAFIAAALIELSDAAKRSLDVDPEEAEAQARSREEAARFRQFLPEDDRR